MDIVAQKEKKVDDGVHNGVIRTIRYREKPDFKFDYTDISIEMADGFIAKVSYPTFINPSSKLGLLLERFGCTITEGQSFDPEKILLEKKCQFQTTTEGKYYKVLTDSVKPTE